MKQPNFYEWDSSKTSGKFFYNHACYPNLRPDRWEFRADNDRVVFKSDDKYVCAWFFEPDMKTQQKKELAETLLLLLQTSHVD